MDLRPRCRKRCTYLCFCRKLKGSFELPRGHWEGGLELGWWGWGCETVSGSALLGDLGLSLRRNAREIFVPLIRWGWRSVSIQGLRGGRDCHAVWSKRNRCNCELRVRCSVASTASRKWQDLQKRRPGNFKIAIRYVTSYMDGTAEMQSLFRILKFSFLLTWAHLLSWPPSIKRTRSIYLLEKAERSIIDWPRFKPHSGTIEFCTGRYFRKRRRPIDQKKKRKVAR